jgi:hypothetical protein
MSRRKILIGIVVIILKVTDQNGSETRVESLFDDASSWPSLMGKNFLPLGRQQQPSMMMKGVVETAFCHDD